MELCSFARVLPRLRAWHPLAGSANVAQQTHSFFNFENQERPLPTASSGGKIPLLHMFGENSWCCCFPSLLRVRPQRCNMKLSEVNFYGIINIESLDVQKHFK